MKLTALNRRRQVGARTGCMSAIRQKGNARILTAKYMACKRILLTGGNGILGYNALKLLADDGRYEVHARVRNIACPAILQMSSRIRFIEHDLNDTVYIAQML